MLYLKLQRRVFSFNRFFLSGLCHPKRFYSNKRIIFRMFSTVWTIYRSIKFLYCCFLRELLGRRQYGDLYCMMYVNKNLDFPLGFMTFVLKATNIINIASGFANIIKVRCIHRYEASHQSSHPILFLNNVYLFHFWFLNI